MPITVPGASSIASGGVNNRVMTAVDANSIQGEANLRFDGTKLGIGAGFTVDNQVHIYSGDSGLASASTTSILVLENNTEVEMSFLAPSGVARQILFAENGDNARGAIIYRGSADTPADALEFRTTSYRLGMSLSAGVLTMGGGVAADTAIIFDNGGTDYHVGIDQNVNDFVIGTGTTLGTNQVITINDDGHMGFGGPDPSSVVLFLFNADARSIPAGYSEVSLMAISGSNTLTLATGATGLVSSLILYPPNIVEAGGDGVTNTATVFIGNAATEGSGGNYALWVNAGVSRFNGGTLIGDSASLNNLIDDASGGSGSTTLYIGDETITTSSDERLKTGIRPTQANAMDLVNRFNVVDFEWDDPTDTAEYDKNYRGSYTGMLAQETVKIAPWIINDQGGGRNCDECLAGQDCEEHGMWIVSYQNLVPTLVKAIQELNEKIQELEHGNR